jgi:ABC-type uncharacterized transport system substrate-binding protein
LHFDSAQRLTAVVEEWGFEDLYTAFVVNDLKKKKDGSVPSSELQPLANQNVADLKEWGYFTIFKADGIRQTLGPATEPQRLCSQTPRKGPTVQALAEKASRNGSAKTKLRRATRSVR